MHQYVTGHWAASSYTTGGSRTDHVLFLSTDETFRWVSESNHRRSLRVGKWKHDAEQDVLTLAGMDDTGQPVLESWSIHYVSGCEEANTILVLQWVRLASRNLPIFFQRIHPPEDPVWRPEPNEGG